MFEEMRDFFAGIIATSVAGVRSAQDAHRDNMERSRLFEEMKREDMERERIARERNHALSEREVVAWERIASALEQLASEP